MSSGGSIKKVSTSPQRNAKPMTTKIAECKLEAAGGQTAAAVRDYFEKVSFSLDVFFTFASPSHAKRYVLGTKKNYNNKCHGSGDQRTAREGRKYFLKVAIPLERFAMDAVTGQQQ